MRHFFSEHDMGGGLADAEIVDWFLMSTFRTFYRQRHLRSPNLAHGTVQAIRHNGADKHVVHEEIRLDNETLYVHAVEMPQIPGTAYRAPFFYGQTTAGELVKGWIGMEYGGVILEPVDKPDSEYAET